jgi:hypothetical protein
VIRDVVVNGVVMVAAPQLHSLLCTFLERLDPQSYKVFLSIQKLFISFQSMSACMKLYQDSKATPTSLAPQTDLELAVAALPGLWTVCNSQFIRRTVDLCMMILNDNSASTHCSRARSLLLHLLAHGSHPVQAAAYDKLKEILTSHSSFPPSLGVDFLQELCHRGALSSSPDISSPATAILCCAMSERGEENNWLTDGLMKNLPFIEASLGSDDGLFTVFWGFLNSESVPELVKVHSLLRMLFSTSTGLRKNAFTHLTHLQAFSLSPSHSSSPVTHDILVVGKSVHSNGEIIGFELNDITRLLDIVKSSVVDDLLKRSALEQLAILLKDFSLHQPAIEEGIICDLLSMFKLKLKPKPTRGGEEEGRGADEWSQSPRDRDEEGTQRETGVVVVDGVGFLKPCVQCLQLLSQTSAEVRGQLASDVSFLLDVVKAATDCPSDPEFLQATAYLLANLLFSSTARWTSNHSMEIPQNLMSRLKFTFSVGSFKLESSHKTPHLLPPSQISHLPAPHILSLLYHTAMAGGIKHLIATPLADTLTKNPEKMLGESEGEVLIEAPPLLAGDIVALRALWYPLALKDCLTRLREAGSHARVTCWLDHMTLIGECYRYEGMSCDEVMTSLGDGDEAETEKWNETFGRFLQVTPATTPDRILLSHLLQYLTTLLDSGCLPRRLYGASFLPWLVEHTAGTESACLQTIRSLVERREGQDEGGRQLERGLLLYYTALSSHLPTLARPHSVTPDGRHSQLPSNLSLVEASLPLLQTLSSCVSQLSVSCHGNLPSLQSCLQCLTHQTAQLCSGSGASSANVLEVCTHLATSLRETVCSVIMGRGEMLASFMGRGVLSGASLALSLILGGVASTKLTQNWYTTCLRSDRDACGFSWLHYLTSNRNPQVRCTGYSILATMCRERGTVENLALEWAPQDKFGLWGACMRVGADMNEWTLVRQQALLVLVSLSAVCCTHELWEQLLAFGNVKGSAALDLFLSDHPPVQLLAASVPSSPVVAAPLLQLLHNLTLSFPQLMLSKLEPLKDFAELLLR